MVFRYLFMFFIIIASGKSYSVNFSILRGDGIGHQPLNDTNVLYFPGALKPSQKTPVLSGTGGGSGDEDDSHRKKPPFFITPDLPFIVKDESWFGQILNEIARRLGLPLSEKEEQEQEAYLDQLEADLREYRQQQQAELLGHLASDFSFSHYPGYQESGWFGKESYSVPGMTSLPHVSTQTTPEVGGSISTKRFFVAFGKCGIHFASGLTMSRTPYGAS